MQKDPEPDGPTKQCKTVYSTNRTLFGTKRLTVLLTDWQSNIYIESRVCEMVACGLRFFFFIDWHRCNRLEVRKPNEKPWSFNFSSPRCTIARSSSTTANLRFLIALFFLESTDHTVRWEQWCLKKGFFPTSLFWYSTSSLRYVFLKSDGSELWVNIFLYGASCNYWP